MVQNNGNTKVLAAECDKIAFQSEWWKEKLMNIEQFFDKYIIYISWLTPEMALQDVIMANARLNNVSLKY